jgi:tetratricopeptide (TPR) repeat protein
VAFAPHIRAPVIALVAIFALPHESSAQTSMDALQIMRQQGTELNGMELPSNHSSRCRGARGLTHEQSIISCGRVIGERDSRTTTATAHFHRASHYEELGDKSAARVDFERAVDLYSQVMLSERRSARAVYNRGVALARMDEFERALADYAAALALSPEWDAPSRSAGYVHFRRNDYNAALAAFDAALALDIDDSSNHAARCEALVALRSFDEAETACGEALRLGEEISYPLIANGYLRYRQGRYEEAYESFAHGLELDADSALALYGRGVSAVRLGRQAEGEVDITLARNQSQRAVSLYANAGMAP